MRREEATFDKSPARLRATLTRFISGQLGDYLVRFVNVSRSIAERSEIVDNESFGTQTNR